MKSLFLIRHAKSSWDDPSISDFDRPLNERGKQDAPRMGKWLKKHNEIPDIIISSPAKRAKKTAIKIAAEVKYDDEKIRWEKQLYETPVSTWLRVICEIPDKYKTAFVVGHNDTLTQFANYLTGENIINVPTCGIVKINFSAAHWKEISIHSGDFQWFQFPKNPHLF